MYNIIQNNLPGNVYVAYTQRLTPHAPPALNEFDRTYIYINYNRTVG